MKGLLSTLLFSVIVTLSARSQYVPIPDMNFQLYLQNQMPGCFNFNGLMDTTCADVLARTDLDISWYNVGTVEGLQYFKSLKTFSAALLNEIPAFPRSLKKIKIESGAMPSIPPLPDSLLELNLWNSQFITSVPPLPATLTYLNLAGTNTGVPPLPNGLKVLDFSFGYAVTSFPSLPPSLEELWVRACFKLTNLPPLPASLKKLDCGYDSLLTLPALPNGLKMLYIIANPNWSSLPNVPDSLKLLDITLTSFTSLPALPAGLDSLYASQTKIGGTLAAQSLPASLKTLMLDSTGLTALPPSLPSGLLKLNIAQNRKLQCLPILPATLKTILTSNSNSIQCVPNVVPNLIIKAGSSKLVLPYCNPVSNAAGCQAMPLITGTVFYDLNNNGSRDAGEPLYKRGKITLSNGASTFTNADGFYKIAPDTTSNFTVKVTAPAYFKAVPDSATHAIAVGGSNITSDFALEKTVSKDSINVELTEASGARPGWHFAYDVNYKNAGSVTQGATNITVNFNSNILTYDSVSNPAVIRNGNQLSLSLSSLPAGTDDKFTIHFNLKTTAVLGDSVIGYASMTTAALTSQDTSRLAVRASFDPNDKSATPYLTRSQILYGQYIEYRINYQNTGNDTAFHVVIADTLNNQLQWNTLEMVASSHVTNATVKDNVVYFEMRNILLPDSNTNAAQSQGYVIFRIRPKTTVASGADIPNKAAIYFDYNAPIITNTAITQIRNAVMPLKLLSFKGYRAGEADKLNWTTADEVNTKFFEVEKSTDGKRFSSAGYVYAHGRGSGEYSYTIEKPVAISNFYRLKMMDLDGAFTYSNVVLIKGNTKGAFVLVANPVKDKLVLTVISPSLINTEAKLISSAGMVVKSFVIRGTGNQTVSVESLPAGVYYLQTTEGSEKVLK